MGIEHYCLHQISSRFLHKLSPCLSCKWAEYRQYPLSCYNWIFSLSLCITVNVTISASTCIWNIQWRWSLYVHILCGLLSCYVIAAPYVRSVGDVFAYLYTLNDDLECPIYYETSLLPEVFPSTWVDGGKYQYLK